MADYQHLALERDGQTLVVTMTNPPRQMLNAPMVRELHAVADALAEDETVRVLILTGGAEGVFITHYDVGELSSVSDAARSREEIGAGPELHDMHRLILKLQALPQPVIAAVNGTAMGGGCELALGCDFRIIARGGVFGLPEVRVGILPGAGGTQRMTRLLGTAKALELMLLGEAVDADEAARIGLAHRAVDPERLMPEAKALASELASRPRLSVALIKQCVLRGSEMALEDALRFEQDAFWKTMRSEDASRLMRAYLSGRRALNEMDEVSGD
jgi:enoyl-CoA hydratase